MCCSVSLHHSPHLFFPFIIYSNPPTCSLQIRVLWPAGPTAARQALRCNVQRGERGIWQMSYKQPLWSCQSGWMAGGGVSSGISRLTWQNIPLKPCESETIPWKIIERTNGGLCCTSQDNWSLNYTHLRRPHSFNSTYSFYLLCAMKRFVESLQKAHLLCLAGTLFARWQHPINPKYILQHWHGF